MAGVHVLHCKMCGAAISKPISFLEGGKYPSAWIKDEEPLTEPGIAFVSEEPWSRSLDGPKAPLEFSPQVWMRLDDLLDSVVLTTNRSRLNGCCGLDGCDGPNRVCSCGAEVGTDISDCWTPRMFIPQPEGTEWQGTRNANPSSPVL